MKKSKKLLSLITTLAVAFVMCFGCLNVFAAEDIEAQEEAGLQETVNTEVTDEGEVETEAEEATEEATEEGMLIKIAGVEYIFKPAAEEVVVLQVKALNGSTTSFYMGELINESNSTDKYKCLYYKQYGQNIPLKNVEAMYSCLNSYGSAGAEAAYGPTVDSILSAAGIKISSLSGKSLKFADASGYSNTFSYDYIIAAERYSFGSVLFNSGYVDMGHAITEAEAGTVVDTIIDLKYTKKGGTRLIFGQATPTERTNQGFISGVAAYGEGMDDKTGEPYAGPGTITVIADEVKQNNGEVSVESNFVEVGTDIELQYSTDKKTGISGNIYYTLDGSEPTLNSEIYNYNTKENYWKPINITKAGKYTFKSKVFSITGKPSETVSFKLTVVDPKISSSTYYKAKPRKPSVKISGLKSGKDYKVSYSNNKYVGQATVKITGLKSYKGTIEKTFNIKPAKGKIYKTYTYGKGSKKFKVIIKDQSKSKIDGYLVRYKKSGGEYSYYRSDLKTKLAITDVKPGKYYVNVKAYKNVGDDVILGSWSKTKTVRVR